MMHQRPIPVVRVILEDLDNNFLLLKRNDKTYCSNKWCLPGGKVDYGKTVEQTCIDEVKQETNLNISDLVFLFYSDAPPSSGDIGHYIDFS